MNGTEYTKQSEDGVTSLLPVVGEGSKTEISQTSGETSSKTQYPEMHLIDNVPYIDMPGFNDTTGKIEDIRTGISTQLIAAKCNTVKAITLVCKETDLRDTRFRQLRDPLKKAGLIFSNNPMKVKSNFILIITAPADCKDSLDVYKAQVLIRLNNWYEKEIQFLTPDKENYGIKNILPHLTKDNLIIVEADKPESRVQFKEKLRSIDTSLRTGDFDFAHYHDCSESFKKFLDKMNQYRCDLQNEAQRCIAALSLEWKKEIQPIAFQSSVNITQAFQALAQENHSEISRLAKALELELEQHTAEQGVVGNNTQVLQSTIQMLNELADNMAFFKRLDDISDLMHSKKQEPQQETKTKDSKNSDYSLPSVLNIEFFKQLDDISDLIGTQKQQPQQETKKNESKQSDNQLPPEQDFLNSDYKGSDASKNFLFFKQPNNEWYSDEKIRNLLSHYLAAEKVSIAPAIPKNGETILREALITAKEDEKINYLVVPINLGLQTQLEADHGTHWTLLLVHFDGDRNNPMCYYRDSLGGVLSEIRVILSSVFPGDNQANIRLDTTVGFHQQDGYSCGAWVVKHCQTLAKPKLQDSIKSDAEQNGAGNKHTFFSKQSTVVDQDVMFLTELVKMSGQQFVSIVFTDSISAKAFQEKLFKQGFENISMSGQARKINMLDDKRFQILLTEDEYCAINNDDKAFVELQFMNKCSI